MSGSFFTKLLLALILGLVVIFVFERLDVSSLSAPLCLAIALMAISLRQSPLLVVTISLVYTLLAACSAFYFLYNSNHPHLPFPYPVFALVQGVGAFAVVCAMAIYMSFYRTTSQQLLADVRNTLSKLPVPVVVSDASGLIIYTNESLNAFLQYLPPDLTGKKYTDFFMPAVHESKAMRRYLELFGVETNSVHEIDILPFGTSVPMLARLTCHGAGSKRTMITVLQPPDSTLRRVFKSDHVELIAYSNPRHSHS
jgi:PAS domain-containing protein